MSLFTTGIIEEFLTTHQNGSYVFQFVLSATGAGTFTVPAGVTQIDVGCWGAGGAGGGNAPAGSAGYQGGGGGGYAFKSISTTPGTQYSYNIGAGGIGFEASPTSGGTSYFGPLGCTIGTCTVRAMGGGAGNITDSGIGGGGSSLWQNIGSPTYVGGYGATGTVSGTRKSGGGGSGAGSTQNGNNGAQGDGAGAWASGGTAAITLGGAGGNGYQVDSNITHGKTYGNGQPGYAYGGGGGGAARLGSTIGEPAVNGGNGFQGLIIINCIIP